ncbi:MAG: hypothetical protein WD009_01335 [Phycisphaeraceae bacterium]
MPDAPGLHAVAIDGSSPTAPLRLCALLGAEPGTKDPRPRPVLLRSRSDAQVYLGGVLDATDRVHQWLELWVQCVDGLAQTPAGVEQGLTNPRMDEMWAARAHAAAEQPGGPPITTGWERSPAAPLVIDLVAGEALRPQDDAGRRWMLCRDNGLLEAHGLPPYAASLHRYLFAAGDDDAAARFVPATRDAPRNEHTIEPADALGLGPDRIAFNLAGLMLVKPLASLSFDAWLDLLAGQALPNHADPQHAVGASGARGEDGDWLFLGAHGQWGRCVETLHLKLRVLADCVAAVQAVTEHEQRPQLCLDASRFRVALGPTGTGLPRLWTGRGVFADPATARAVALGATSASLHVPIDAAASIYGPAAGGGGDRGAASLRIRQVTDTSDGAVVTGTLTTHDRLTADRDELVHLRPTLGQQAVDLYVTVDRDDTLSTPQWAFRSLPHRFDDALRGAVDEAVGVSLDAVPFQVVRSLSSPCDLYALAVLATRTLLVDGQTPLPEALDALVSLAREVNEGQGGAGNEEPIEDRIASLLDEPRWAEALGPQRVGEPGLSAADALAIIPLELWSRVLAALVRMLPGQGVHSTCRGWADAPPGALHRVFDRARGDLQNLVIHTRSLIVIDWRHNREIHTVLQQAMHQQGATA